MYTFLPSDYTNYTCKQKLTWKKYPSSNTTYFFALIPITPAHSGHINYSNQIIPFTSRIYRLWATRLLLASSFLLFVVFTSAVNPLSIIDVEKYSSITFIKGAYCYPFANDSRGKSGSINDNDTLRNVIKSDLKIIVIFGEVKARRGIHLGDCCID